MKFNKTAIIEFVLLVVFVIANLVVFFSQSKTIQQLNIEKAELSAQVATLSDTVTALETDKQALTIQIDELKNRETEFRVLYANPGDHPIGDDETANKTSMTLEEIANAPFPKGYLKETWKGTECTQETTDYPEGIDHSLLMGELATLGELKIENSGIEDGMIYTLCKGTYQDGTPIEVLYINHPNTQQFVAASVTQDDYENYVLYTFYY